MPIAAEKALEREADKRGLTGEERDRFVFGVLRHKFGWQPKREKKLTAILDDLIEFKIHLNPANKGKFTATKKKTGKSTAELKKSKNPLTRKRATFAENARKWVKNRRKNLSAQLDELIELGVKSIGASPLGREMIKAKNGLIAKKVKKLAPTAGKPLHKFTGPLCDYGAVSFPKITARAMSARLDRLIELGDPRPRNPLGEFTQQQDGVADPNSMAKTYRSVTQNLAGGAVAGVGAASTGLAVKALYNKIRKARGLKL